MFLIDHDQFGTITNDTRCVWWWLLVDLPVLSGLQEDETKFAFPVSFMIRRIEHTGWDEIHLWKLEQP